MAVYNKTGGYTETANKLAKEIEPIINQIIPKYMIDDDMSLEELEYIVSHAINRIGLRTQLEIRMNKSNIPIPK
jgi:uncharacterized protein YtpQ (UPF0354 family)